MARRKLLTLLMAMLMAAPLLAGQAWWCLCAADLGGSSLSSCCCKGAHAAADAARSSGQDTVHRECCCDEVDTAVPQGSPVDAPHALEGGVLLGAFCPHAPALAAERLTARGLLTAADPPEPSPRRGLALADLKSVRLRP